MFATIAVLTLGLGIGGTTAMFSVVDGVLIKELPYQDPATLVSISKAYPSWEGREGVDYVWDHISFPWVDYQNVANQAETLSAVGAFRTSSAVLTDFGTPERVSSGGVSASLFDLLGVRAALGRTFHETEVPPGGDAAHVVLLSHELWVRRFGKSPDVLGQTLRLEGDAFEVVGVLPSGFRLPSDMVSTHSLAGAVDPGLRDLWMPLGIYSDLDRCGNCLEVIGRLAPGRTSIQARAEVQALLDPTRGPEDQLVRVISRKKVVTGGFATPLLLLLGAAGVLLLIACTNVAGLLIGEATRRRHEIAVRFALGAGRWRILRQLLTESVLLGLAGAVVGVTLAWFGTSALLAAAPPFPRLEEVTLSARVLAVAMAAGVGTGLLFGLAPALALVTRSTESSLRSQRGSGDAGTRALQAAVVCLQVSLTVMLLVAGGLFGKSLVRVMSVDPGFNPEDLVVLDVSTPPGTTLETENLHGFYNELVYAVEQVRGVAAVSTTSDLPFPGGGTSQTFEFQRDGATEWTVHWVRSVSPSYHEMLGIPLLLGRPFSESDGPDSDRVMLVSEAVAEQSWPGETPLGVVVHHNGEDRTIIGVVGDVHQKTLGSPAEPTFYLPVRQAPRWGLSFAVRTTGDPAHVIPAIRKAIWSVNADIPISGEGSMQSLMREAESDDRFRAVLMWTFAAIATALAAVGIFGITARTVASRRRELGIRAALGAGASGLMGLVLRDGLRNVLIGTGLGLLGAYWAAGLIAHLLYDVGDHDPGTYSAVAGLTALVCMLAAYLPARRITAIAPGEVLSEE